MSIWGDNITIGLGAASANQPWLAALLATVMVVTFLLVLWLSYKRLRHSSNSRLSLVWICNLCAFIAVGGLLSDVRLASVGVKSAYLLTSGARLPQHTDIDDSHDVYVMADRALQHPADTLLTRAIMIEDAAQLATLQPELEHLQVLGDGLTAAQWQAFFAISPVAQAHKLSVSFYPSERRLGPIDLTWQKHLAPGEYLQLNGILQGPADTHSSEPGTDFVLALLDPRQQVVEQQRVKAGGSFNFAVAGSQSGQWIYNLQVSDGITGAILTEDPVAFEVSVKHPPAILIKQSAPSFETRQIKNWASHFGSRVTVVSQISQNNSIVQQLNAPDEAVKQEPSDPFLNATLDAFDLLVMDARALKALPAKQLSDLYSAIFQGLGVLIIADETSLAEQTPAPWLDDLIVKPLEGSPDHYQTIPQWTNGQLTQNTELPALKLSAAGAKILVKDDEARPLVAANDIGLGKVAVSLINNSYQWQISGHSEEYSHYWQTLLKQLARSNKKNSWMPQSLTTLFYTAHNNTLCALSSDNSMYLQTDIMVRLTADAFQPDKSCASYWAQKAGWQQFDLALEPDGSAEEDANAHKVVDSQRNYVYQSKDWQAWQQASKHRASQQIASLSPPPGPARHLESINKFYFWWLLLLAGSLLWLERKFYQTP